LVYHFIFVLLQTSTPNRRKRRMLRHESLSAGWGCDFSR